MLNIHLKIEAKEVVNTRFNRGIFMTNAKDFNNLYQVFEKDLFLLPYKVQKLSKRARRNLI